MKNYKPKLYKKDGIKIVRFSSLCKACGLCIEKCPAKCISWSDKDLGFYGTPTVEIDIEKCIGCKQCEIICPDMAIKVEKAKS